MTGLLQIQQLLLLQQLQLQLHSPVMQNPLALTSVMISQTLHLT